MITVVVVADRIRQELNDDYVGLWVLPWHLRRALPSATDDEIRETSEVILGGLLQRGVAFGELDGQTGTFVPCPQADALETAINEWRALGRDPNIGEIGWLALQT